MIFLIILLIFILFIIWILIAPIQIIIDSRKNIYLVRWKGIASAIIFPNLEKLEIRIQVFFWKKELLPFSTKRKKKKSPTKNKEKRKRKGFLRFSWEKLIKIIGSWNLKVCKINIDTHDVIRNSYLVPIFYFLQNKKRSLNINYQGLNQLDIEMENTVGRMLKAYIFN